MTKHKYVVTLSLEFENARPAKKAIRQAVMEGLEERFLSAWPKPKIRVRTVDID